MRSVGSHSGSSLSPRFARCYIAVCECLRKEEDLRRLVREVAEDSAESGALHAGSQAAVSLARAKAKSINGQIMPDVHVQV